MLGQDMDGCCFLDILPPHEHDKFLTTARRVREHKPPVRKAPKRPLFAHHTGIPNSIHERSELPALSFRIAIPLIVVIPV